MREGGREGERGRGRERGRGGWDEVTDDLHLATHTPSCPMAMMLLSLVTDTHTAGSGPAWWVDR